MLAAIAYVEREDPQAAAALQHAIAARRDRDRP